MHVLVMLILNYHVAWFADIWWCCDGCDSFQVTLIRLA
jgi:hypothetical protein